MQVQNTKRIVLKIQPPLLPGSISTAKSTCGKPNCACKGTPPKLHGVYYRWTGFLEGKRTTKTLRKEVAEECERRIQNYHKLLRQIEKILAQGLAHAPWKDTQRNRRNA
jgi:hypothetical protein